MSRQTARLHCERGTAIGRGLRECDLPHNVLRRSAMYENGPRGSTHLMQQLYY